MKKSLIAAAVAAGMATPMIASADATVYGILYAGVTQLDNGTTTSVTQDDNEGTGRLGFKFEEELGGGLTSFGVLEFQVDTSDTVAAGNCERVNGSSANTITSSICYRQTHGGIKAGWGSIALGRFHSAYKTTGGVKFDPFVATDLQARGNGGMAAGSLAQNSFVSQLVEYKSPKMSGFQLQYQTSVNDANTDVNGGERNTSWGVEYTGVKGLKVIVASATDGGNSTGTEDRNNMKFGAKYNISKEMFVTVQSESVEVANSGAGDYMYLNFGYKMGGTLIVLAHGTQALDSGTDTTYMALGAITSLSKSTQLIYGYRSSDVDGGAETTALTVGLKQKF
jgi:predicted porin